MCVVVCVTMCTVLCVAVRVAVCCSGKRRDTVVVGICNVTSIMHQRKTKRGQMQHTATQRVLRYVQHSVCCGVLERLSRDMYHLPEREKERHIARGRKRDTLKEGERETHCNTHGNTH